MALRVLGVPGSLRKGSHNRALLRAAIELAPAGMTIEIFEGVGALPLYDADVEAGGDPPAVVAWKSAIAAADALLIVTPEYNYGVPGVLKNAVDWASRPPGNCVLNRKPAALMGGSPGGAGTTRAQLALRQSFVFTDTRTMLQPEVLVSRVHEKIDADGRLTDEPTRKMIRKLLDAFADWAPHVGAARPA
ncbi:MAG TPA: NADPH-dependent FMN reductase [Candidatus Binatia bacterium]|jgi:chromate reductase